jgi:dTDP-L-rhamnose 4-epimerase
MGESILVTGGAGFIGSHLVDELLEDGNRVRVFDNLDPQVHGDLRERGSWPAYCNPGAEYVAGDVRDRDALLRALKDIDVVFHLAARVGVGQSMYEINSYIDVNIAGTSVLLDILANDRDMQERVRKLIVASSMSNYGEGAYECPIHGRVYPQLRPTEQLSARQWEVRCPYEIDSRDAGHSRQCGKILRPIPTPEEKPQYSGSVYAIAKKTQEELCQVVGSAYEIPTVALRFFNTYGTRQALSNPYTGVLAIFSGRLLNEQPPVIFEDGLQIRDFVHVSDIVQANTLAMNHSEASGVYNVGSGRPTTILEVAQRLGKQIGSSQQPEILNLYRAGDIRHCYADVRRIQALGYAPQVGFEQGVAGLVEWLQDQAPADRFEQMNVELTKRGLAI